MKDPYIPREVVKDSHIPTKVVKVLIIPASCQGFSIPSSSRGFIFPDSSQRFYYLQLLRIYFPWQDSKSAYMRIVINCLHNCYSYDPSI